MSKLMKRITMCQLLLVIGFFYIGEARTESDTSADSFQIIAHRGASGYLPEHTLPAYQLAIMQGADFIEPDLVVTKDHQLVCLHDISLSRTTDVQEHKRFLERRREINGQVDWFVSDFTLAELKQLRTRQAYKGRPREHDDQFEIPTLQEVINLINTHERNTGHRVGIYPELKAPGFFAEVDFSNLLLEQLEANNLTDRREKVFIQSFNLEILRELHGMTELPLVMLLRPASRSEPATPNVPLSEVAPFVDAIGASKYLILGVSGADGGFVADARRYGLPVHAWTIRDDDVHFAFKDVQSELAALRAAGVKGVFTDFPDTAVEWRDNP